MKLQPLMSPPMSPIPRIQQQSRLTTQVSSTESRAHIEKTLEGAHWTELAPTPRRAIYGEDLHS